MTPNDTLGRIRRELFYGLGRYTKSLPDFVVSETLSVCGRKVRATFLEQVRRSIADEAEVLAYVHLPFCASECPYCNTFPYRTDRAVQGTYLGRLIAEIGRSGAAGVFEGKTFRSVFFGGGTPTTYANEDLAALLAALFRHAPLAPGGSVTTEATPATVDSPARLRGLADIGFTRLSIGCQTFDETIARRCNRRHTVPQIARIIRTAQDRGMSTNIDIMLGLPGQTADTLRRDLDALETIRPDAVEFIRHEVVNPRVVALYRRQPELKTGDDALFEMILLAHRWSEQHGYEQNGRFTNDRAYPHRYYWVREWPVLAFGTRVRSHTKTICWETPDSLELYARLVEGGPSAVGRCRFLTPRDQMYRSLFLNLQTAAGLDRGRFQTRFGEDPVSAFPRILPPLEALGCVEADANAVRLSRNASYFFEDICCYIMDAALAADYPQFARAPFTYGPAQQEAPHPA
jgi:oxygen-independent coproporphyrinogen-3 oxidase